MSPNLPRVAEIAEAKRSNLGEDYAVAGYALLDSEAALSITFHIISGSVR